MKLIEFNLTMPNRGSWNNKWSGDGQLFSIVKEFTDKQFKDYNIKALLDRRNFTYNWDDGWSANVCVKLITKEESKYIKKHSQGFYGYNWMIDSILKYGEIKIIKE